MDPSMRDQMVKALKEKPRVPVVWMQFQDCTFDDEGAKAGYCLFKLGCRGTSTFNSCAELLWNGGTGFPIQAGNICLGCSEENFWDKGSFFAKRTKVPGKQTMANTTVPV